MTFKQRVYMQFGELVAQKVANLKKQLSELQESTAGETKSTAGDKYETARAMLQIEQDNVRRQLQEALEMQSQHKSTNIDSDNAVIRNGSLVKTNRGWFYISVALGKTSVDDIVVIAISPKSPLGLRLLGLKSGDDVKVNDINYTIEKNW